MKIKSMVLLVACCLISSTVIATEEECPSVDAIISHGLDRIEKKPISEQQPWVGIQNSQYNTNEEWRLFAYGFADDTTTDANAKQKALEKLPYLKYVYGPAEMIGGTPGNKACQYYCPDDQHKIYALVITPPQDAYGSSLHLK